MNRSPVVEFCYDISCPFAYIASTRIEALANRCRAEIIWKPVLLGAIYDQIKAPQGKAGSASDVFNPTKAAISKKQMATTLKRYKIPLNWPERHPQKTTAALRLIYYTPNTHRPALTHALFKAYWVDQKDVTDVSYLISLAKSLDIPQASALTESILNAQELQDLLRSATSEAVKRGAPGVPFFYVPQERTGDSGELGKGYWGQDRMGFVEASLVALGKSINYEDVQNLSGVFPRCAWEASESAKGPCRLEFWYDFSSPWAFIGSTQLERVKKEAKAAGIELEIVMKPILVGALFKIIGAPNVPLLDMPEQKRNYMSQDQRDWVRHWNGVLKQAGMLEKPISIQFPTEFPIRTPLALRCSIVEPKTFEPLFRAAWVDDIPISKQEILADVLTKAGLDAEKIITEANQQEVKDTLRKYTSEAQELGLCGVPGYRVLRKQSDDWVCKGGMTWGQDTINVVQDMINGWDEDSSAKYADVSAERLSATPKAGDGNAIAAKL